MNNIIGLIWKPHLEWVNQAQNTLKNNPQGIPEILFLTTLREREIADDQ